MCVVEALLKPIQFQGVPLSVLRNTSYLYINTEFILFSVECSGAMGLG